MSKGAEKAAAERRDDVRVVVDLTDSSGGQTAIPGDLSDSQLDELRRNLSSTAQLQNAAQAIKLLASQQEEIYSDLGSGSRGQSLSTVTEDVLLNQLGLAEANARMAQAGLTPITSVEGKIRVLEFVTQHVVQTAKLEPMARLEAEKLILQYRQLLVSQTSELKIAQLEAENKALEAQTQNLVLSHELELRKQGAIADLHVDAKANDAGRRRKSVEIDKQNIDLDAEERRLKREKAIASKKKELDDWRTLRNLRQQRWAPMVRRVAVGVATVVLVANLVADDPSRSEAPVLGAVNDTWDGMYEPIRDGVIRTYEDLSSRGDG